MSIEKRLTRIETSLTPEQAVLLWLKEVQPQDLDTFLTYPAHEPPIIRVSEMAARAVRERLQKQEMAPASIQHAERAAAEKAAFLVMIVRALHHHVALACQFAAQAIFIDGLDSQRREKLDPPLAEKLAPIWRLLDNLVELGYFYPPPVLRALARIWEAQQVITKISEKYFDGHPVLNAGVEGHLNQSLERLQSRALALKDSKLPSSITVDLVKLESRIKGQSLVIEGKGVAIESEVLKGFGHWVDAEKLLQQHYDAVVRASL